MHMPLLGYASLVAFEGGRQVYDVLEVALLSKDPVASKRLPRIKRIEDIRVTAKVSYHCFGDHTCP